MSVRRVLVWGTAMVVGTIIFFNQVVGPSVAASIEEDFAEMEADELHQPAPDPVISTPQKASALSKEELRKAVKMSDLPPMDDVDRMIGATINLNGYLCARPIEVAEAGTGLYGVRCITRRDGTGISDYLVNARTNDVEPI